MHTEFNFDYHIALKIAENPQYGFYACLLAAFGQADDINMAILKRAFPAVYESFLENQKIELGAKFCLGAAEDKD